MKKFFRSPFAYVVLGCALGAAGLYAAPALVPIVGAAQSTINGSGMLTKAALFVAPAGADGTSNTIGDSNIYDTTNGAMPGKVGIGVSNPAAQLEVYSDTDNVLQLTRGGTRAAPSVLRQGADGALVVNNSGTDVLSFKGGNIGVGTLSPTAPLDIAGAANFRGSVTVPAPVSDTDAASRGWVLAQSAGKTYKKQIFLSNGTWTPPAANTWVSVLVIGGGGGGSGGGDQTGAGGGSGNTQTYIGFVSLAQTITVGAGGAGGASTLPGANGGSSSFGTLAVATGGTAGNGTTPGSGYSSGTPGCCSGTTLPAVPGGVGFMGIGSGGHGGSNYSPGTAGARGAVIVEWLE